MNTIEVDEVWARYFEIGRLQARFLSRSAEIMSASLSSVRHRSARLFELWLGTPWPLLITRIEGPVTASARWADYLEGETRNVAQAAMLTDSEMRGWGERFVRTVEGEKTA